MKEETKTFEPQAYLTVGLVYTLLRIAEDIMNQKEIKS